MHVERPSNSHNLGAHFLAFVESLYVFPLFLNCCREFVLSSGGLIYAIEEHGVGR